MKTLADGTTVMARTYYYLLDFNDLDKWKTLFSEFGKKKLHDLTKSEYIRLFEIATKKDLENLNQ